VLLEISSEGRLSSSLNSSWFGAFDVSKKNPIFFNCYMELKL